MLDTNVLVTAFVFPGGPPEDVYRRVLTGEATIIVSRPLLGELGRVLTEKFGWEGPYVQEVLSQLLRVGELVEPQEPVDVIDEDPADDRVLEAAAEGHADLIVSGDHHLRRLGAWRGIRVVEPARYLHEAD